MCHGALFHLLFVGVHSPILCSCASLHRLPHLWSLALPSQILFASLLLQLFKHRLTNIQSFSHEHSFISSSHAMFLLGGCRAYLFDPRHLEVRCCVFRDQIHIPLTHVLRSNTSGFKH